MLWTFSALFPTCTLTFLHRQSLCVFSKWTYFHRENCRSLYFCISLLLVYHSPVSELNLYNRLHKWWKQKTTCDAKKYWFWKLWQNSNAECKVPRLLLWIMLVNKCILNIKLKPSLFHLKELHFSSSSETLDSTKNCKALRLKISKTTHCQLWWEQN